MKTDKTWIQSYLGKAIDVLNPDPAAFTLEDVAHALACRNRFSGMTSIPYSVAEHCVRGSELIAPEFALPFLLHELGEVALPDIPSPLKPHVRVRACCEQACKAHEVPWHELEKRHETAILAALDLSHLQPRIHDVCVKKMDLSMLAWEARELLLPPPMPWWPAGEAPVPAMLGSLRPWDWQWAKDMFVEAFQDLTHKANK